MSKISCEVEKKGYSFRIPTCANIAYGDINSWLNDWHSLSMLLEIAQTNNFKWVEEYTIKTLLSDLAVRIKEAGFFYSGFDWEEDNFEERTER